MEKAADVIKDILQEALIQSSEQAIQAVDSNTVIRYMNRYMAALDANGVSLGYTKIDNPNDFVTVPDGALEGIVFNVAKRILSSYDVPMSNELLLNARDSERVLYKLGVSISPTYFPDTLPIGSGNEHELTDRGSVFYNGNPDSILAENGDSVGLESGT